MKLRYRRIIYLTFIGFFLIAVPTVSFYAAGYSYNFKRHKIEKTGILYIDSKPKDALIYINDQYEAKTPKRFARLLPDIYKIRVEKNGYYSWEKELEVKSNLTTFSKDIILFKKNLPINIIEGEISILASSKNQEKIIYSLTKENIDELRLLNLRSNEDILIKQFNNQAYNQLEFMEWSPSQNKALLKEVIGEFAKYLIVDIETLKVREIFDITRLNFNKVSWDTLDDNYLYALRKAVFYQIDLFNNSTKILLSANIEDFQVNKNEAYYITRVANELFLNKIILNGENIELAEKIKLPSPSQYSLQPSTPEYLVLLDKKNNDLFIINSKSFDDENIEDNIVLQDRAKKIIWSKDLTSLLYYTDFEIWTFNFSTRQKNLITRYGETIDQAFWHTGEKYIVYRTGNIIKTIEDNPSEIKNDLQLAELSRVSSLTIDDQGKNLYFIGQAGNKEGIYKLEIQ